jgi:hypothetical protein
MSLNIVLGAWANSLLAGIDAAAAVASEDFINALLFMFRTPVGFLPGSAFRQNSLLFDWRWVSTY